MFSNAIVRTPGSSLKMGLSSSLQGRPDHLIALKQHEIYISHLKALGLKVRVLPPDEKFPDSTFIEDAALCTPACAVITSPGAISRRGETEGMDRILADYFKNVERIKLPGTLEAGDVMMAGKSYFIGLSGRTNLEGADQLILILEKYGYAGIKVPLNDLLHLKSGVSYIENNNILASGELIDSPFFSYFNRIHIDDNEQYSANSLWINGTVLVPEGYPGTMKKIEAAGYKTIAVDVSEFRKVDGGLSCLSLRF
jgi:dimethylargininase